MSDTTSTTTYESLLGDSAVAEALQELGFAAPTLAEGKSIPQLRAWRDAVIALEGAADGARSYIAALVFEKLNEVSKGATIVVAPAAEVPAILKTLSKAKITSGTFAEASESQTVLAGTLTEAKEFFEGETSRSINIVRVIVQGVTSSEVEEARTIFAAASKRGKRPEMVLLADSSDAFITDIIRGYFQVSAVEVQHLFYEVGSGVLDKPKALVDFIEGEGSPKTLVFCNMPSDTDLVEVTLKKKGIPARKLIGNAPSHRLNEAMSQIRSGEATALVVTDISARSVECEEFDLIMNYSIHSDPEVYVHRTMTSSAGNLKKVISLVGPLDRANFHYLKKILEFELTQIELPSSEALMASKVQTLKAQAVQKNLETDERVQTLTSLILANEDRDQIIRYLVDSYLQGNPQSQANHASSGNSSYDEDRPQRGDRRERGNRRGQDRRRGGEDREDGQGEGRFGRRRDESSEEGSSEEGREGRGRGRTRTPHTPPKKITRVYIGKGAAEGISEATIHELTTGHEEVLKLENIKRTSVRENYTFVDIDDEVSATFIDIFEERHGGKTAVKKAITLNQPREESPEDGEGEREQDFSGEGPEGGNQEAAQEETAAFQGE